MSDEERKDWAGLVYFSVASEQLVSNGAIIFYWEDLGVAGFRTVRRENERDLDT